MKTRTVPLITTLLLSALVRGPSAANDTTLSITMAKQTITVSGLITMAVFFALPRYTPRNIRTMHTCSPPRRFRAVRGRFSYLSACSRSPFAPQELQ